MTHHPKSLPTEALQLLDFLRSIADGIAAVAITLAAPDAEALIERELANVAVEMRRYEDKTGSVGIAIDAVLRERIAAKLAERKT